MTLPIAEQAFHDSFNNLKIKYPPGVSMRKIADEYIAKSLNSINDIASQLVSDYASELVMQIVAQAAEMYADDFAEKRGRPLTKSERKPFRQGVREAAAAMMATRLPSVGRGGDTRMAKVPPNAELIAFYQVIVRVHPFWQDVRQRQSRRDDAWQSDAKLLPEYRRFKRSERAHADAVMALLRRAPKINGATADPMTLAREHARLIVGWPYASDRQLREYVGLGKKLAAATVANSAKPTA